MNTVDWNFAWEELHGHLCRLIQFDTTNPPGSETPCIKYVREVLSSVGYEPTVLESAPGRGNVVARLKGSGELGPLLIYGHVDVVPAEADKWKRPPFSGVAADGCIWGRGALDMKDMVAVELECMLLLKRQSLALKRDVIFAATADEESGGEMGAGWLVQNHPELIQAEYGLSEGAGSTLQLANRRLYGVRTAEKATSRFRMKAAGPPGHGSVPRSDSAVLAIARAVTALYENRLPVHIGPTAERYIRTLAQAAAVPLPQHIDEAAVDALAAKIPADMARSLQAIVRNTAVPTGLRAGSKINVIPSEAEALVDARILPGQTSRQLISEVLAVVGPGLTIELLDGGTPQEIEPGDALYQVIERTVKRHEPEASVIPVMLTGATDARWISTLGTRCLGFSPLSISPGFSTDGLVHGHDERIPIAGLDWGTRVFFEIVRDFARGG